MGKASLQISAGTDPGRVRGNNQDSYFAGPFPEGKLNTHGRLLIVADGMGGHAAGEVASGLAVKTASECYYDADIGEDENPGPALKRSFQEANKNILKEGSKNLDQYGMGTTCSGIVVRGDEYWLCHVGDSRIYRWRDGQLECLSKDHTLLAQMMESGDVKENEAANLSIRHILVRAMGIDQMVELDLSEQAYRLQVGDKILICSDGLHGVLSDEEIAQILTLKSDEAAVKALIAESNSGGGPDNITAVLLECNA